MKIPLIRQLLMIVNLLLIGMAQSFAIGEFYSDRPHIADVAAAKDNQEIVPLRLLEAQLDFVIELRVLFAGRKRVYLGRDGELMHDLDWLLWKMWGEDSEFEPQLINVSRKSAQAEGLHRYLKDHQIGRNADAAIVLADTGYEGSVIDAINVVRSKKGYRPLMAHLISSVHPASASSRVATQSYLPRDWQWENRSEEDLYETFLDLVDQQIEEIEGLPHFSESAENYAANPRTGALDAHTMKIQNADELNRSTALQQQVRSYLVKNSRAERRARQIVELLVPFVAALGNSQIDVNNTKSVDDTLKQLKFGLFWHDLLEATIKGTVVIPEEILARLWSKLPGHKPEFFDLTAEEKEQLAKAYSIKDLPAPAERLFIEEILDHHQRSLKKLTAQPSYYDLRVVRSNVKNRQLDFGGGPLAIGAMLGEGVRAEVFELGNDLVLKIPFEADDMRYIEVELMVEEHLRANFATFGIHVWPAVAKGQNGSYIVRRKIKREYLGEQIAKGQLNAEQLKKLEELFYNTKKYAYATGVGLDIKYDNLAWLNNEWVLFDAGPRTSFGPYAFSLDIPDFATFYRLWKDDQPRSNGLKIPDVVKGIKMQARGSDCAEKFMEDKI